jgi:hypothetical protein
VVGEEHLLFISRDGQQLGGTIAGILRPIPEDGKLVAQIRAQLQGQNEVASH